MSKLTSIEELCNGIVEAKLNVKDPNLKVRQARVALAQEILGLIHKDGETKKPSTEDSGETLPKPSS